jgi:hypothetical protein
LPALHRYCEDTPKAKDDSAGHEQVKKRTGNELRGDGRPKGLDQEVINLFGNAEEIVFQQMQEDLRVIQ